MNSFKDKVVVITGGTAGIGRATAVAFAAQGAKVVVAGRREAEGRESVALIEKAGGEGLFLATDVGSEESIVSLIEQTVGHFGRLDIAFNNAGILLDSGPITSADAEMIDRSFAINVRGVALSMKHQIPAMLKNGGGAIVNNASVLGMRPLPGRAIYNATKFAVIGLTKTAALEFATQGIRVNAVSPAIIETDLTAGLISNEDLSARVRALHPVGRFGRPEEVASAVLYLSASDSAFTTGVVLPVDGGFTA